MRLPFAIDPPEFKRWAIFGFWPSNFSAKIVTAAAALAAFASIELWIKLGEANHWLSEAFGLGGPVIAIGFWAFAKSRIERDYRRR